MSQSSSLPHPEPAPRTYATPRPRLWNRGAMSWLYDLAVVHGTYRVLWRCPWRDVAELYARNLRAEHLELAPGSGFFLDRVAFPVATPRLHLLDLHDGPLEASAARLTRYRPTTHHGDALRPFPLGRDAVDSLGCGMLLHCLPGTGITDKAAVFDHAATVLRPGGRFFGATVLAHGTTSHPLGRLGLRALNRTEVFHNARDGLADLRRELTSRFADVAVTVRGMVAMWEARAPEKDASEGRGGRR